MKAGTVASFATTRGANKVIRSYPTNSADVGKKIIYQGRDFNGIWVRTLIDVVMSDGEQIADSDVDAGPRAARAQVRIVGVALGTATGATIPDSGAPLLDRAGRVVTSRRQIHHLEQLTRTTDGALLLADR